MPDSTMKEEARQILERLPDDATWEDLQYEINVRVKDSREGRTPRSRLSATDLRKLPMEQRRAILEAGAKQAEELYHSDRKLTDFEAFGEEDYNEPES